jgi:hypothetical protein
LWWKLSPSLHCWNGTLKPSPLHKGTHDYNADTTFILKTAIYFLNIGSHTFHSKKPKYGSSYINIALIW